MSASARNVTAPMSHEVTAIATPIPMRMSGVMLCRGRHWEGVVTCVCRLCRASSTGDLRVGIDDAFLLLFR